MALQSLANHHPFLTKSVSPSVSPPSSFLSKCDNVNQLGVARVGTQGRSSRRGRRDALELVVCALDRTNGSNNSRGASDGGKKGAVSNSNYVVPLDKSFSPTNSSCITRPLVEILRDLNKRIPDNIIKTSSPPPHDDHTVPTTFIPWYHANRMLSFYAPGWCGEMRDVIFAENGSVTVVYRVTIRGSDGEAHRESTGTVSPGEGHIVDPVAAAEEIAFCRACARFGLGLYLYHKE
ncbi:DNA repair RAD52-like protein 2, chloroplastic [Juglans microcarpa x Juglans regia]|uniref:DNA repair RAD52-like protein 2, chloroplastic n=1 Tax=Juglans microcarpa x Juglans regia TaxID=2249226 RepID=UPI001B7DF206|nr:DNA repair RAD52-like protein 2, chloroplastic [Juglans microcarpa x Juglans regia]